jgi:hypothetical protein
MNTATLTQYVLMYFILPLWLAAGFADYLCHRAVRIEMTTGVKESMLHLLQLLEMGIPVIAIMFLEINSLVIALMIVCFLLHEATALWDLSYATNTRYVSPFEQHVHSFLEMLPLMGLVLIAVLHWEQFLGLFGAANGDFTIKLKDPPLPPLYVGIAIGLVVVFEVIPYLEETWRGLRFRADDAARMSGGKNGDAR